MRWGWIDLFVQDFVRGWNHHCVSIQVFFLWYDQDVFNSCPIDIFPEWYDINAYFLVYIQNVHKEMHIHVHSYNVYKEPVLQKLLTDIQNVRGDILISFKEPTESRYSFLPHGQHSYSNQRKMQGHNGFWENSICLVSKRRQIEFCQACSATLNNFPIFMLYCAGQTEKQKMTHAKEYIHPNRC